MAARAMVRLPSADQLLKVTLKIKLNMDVRPQIKISPDVLHKTKTGLEL